MLDAWKQAANLPPVSLVAPKADDYERIYNHLKRLPSMDRVMLFHGGVSDTTLQQQARRVVEGKVDGRLMIDREGEVRGMVIWARTGNEAEYAVSVDEGWRNKGYGKQLVSIAARESAAQGATHLIGYIRRENDPMLRVARSLTSTLRNEGGDYLATLPICPPAAPASAPALAA